MSTTKLPEAFAEKKTIDAPDGYSYTETMGAWADGYNSALEATGAKELWEALQTVRSTLPHIGGNERSVYIFLQTIDAALSKSNPK